MNQGQGAVISTDERRSGATEEEWRDPEDVRAALPTQGVLPEWLSSEARFATPARESRPKPGSEVRRTSTCEFEFLGVVQGDSTCSSGRTPRISVAGDAFPGSLSVPFDKLRAPRSRSR